MLNKVILIGNVGHTPEVKYVGDGTPVAKFSLATTEKYRGRNGERVEKTEWHNLIAWRRNAEIVQQYVPRGKQLYIEGKLQTRKYTGKDGTDRYATEIVVDRIILLGTRKGESGDSQSEDVPDPDDETSSEDGPPLTDE